MHKDPKYFFFYDNKYRENQLHLEPYGLQGNAFEIFKNAFEKYIKNGKTLTNAGIGIQVYYYSTIEDYNAYKEPQTLFISRSVQKKIIHQNKVHFVKKKDLEYGTPMDFENANHLFDVLQNSYLIAQIQVCELYNLYNDYSLFTVPIKLLFRSYKLIQIIEYFEKRKVTQEKKFCSPDIHQEINELERLEYTDTSSKEKRELFGKHYDVIYGLLHDKYYKMNKFDSKSTYSFLTIQLLKFLNSDDCFDTDVFIFFDFTEKIPELKVDKPHKLIKKIDECRLGKVILPFLLVFNDIESHANLLLFDIPNKKIYRIEPNVGFYLEKNDIIDEKLKIFANKFTYTFEGYLPSTCKKTYHPGLCAFLSVSKFIYGMSFTNQHVKDLIVRFFKHEYSRLCQKQLIVRK